MIWNIAHHPKMRFKKQSLINITLICALLVLWICFNQQPSPQVNVVQSVSTPCSLLKPTANLTFSNLTDIKNNQTLLRLWALNTAETTIRVYNNVCIFPQSNDYKRTVVFKGMLYSFDDQRTTKEDIFVFQILSGNYFTYWQVNTIGGHNLADYMSGEITFENRIAYFPYSWRLDEKATVFTMLHRLLPAAYDQIKWSESLPSLRTAVHNGDTVLIPPLISMYETFHEPFHALGYSELASFENITEKPRCFKHAVLGSHMANFESIREHSQYRREIHELFLQKWKMKENPCPKNNVVILERIVSRHLLNKNAILEAIKNLGFQNSNIVSFEGLTFRQQVQTMHCADVLITVQGAALSWFLYLPPNATVIEIIWDGWPIKYQKRIQKERPDISAQVLKCNASVSDETWSEFAYDWFGFNGTNVPESVKADIVERSENTRAVSRQIWKYSDCICPIDTLLSMLPYVRAFDISTHND